MPQPLRAQATLGWGGCSRHRVGRRESGGVAMVISVEGLMSSGCRAGHLPSFHNHFAREKPSVPRGQVGYPGLPSQDASKPGLGTENGVNLGHMVWPGSPWERGRECDHEASPDRMVSAVPFLPVLGVMF